ncbi:protein with ribonuclease H-like and integrase domains [Klebsormidium nitens]|uniref:Protein with ribonuclease H-like and integrase domains n=1 Tax=Klebsormidium nitens TaxID=105231 RepID=A0A1Y1IQ98_KLENI|nr:protein with ribonuclease H-like and integrase domains [Klebsormidium nitens]|eukprot:GAQ93030.1 protein with ribonuclease H-like and integrase domains [Klebsormidium nitens]
MADGYKGHIDKLDVENYRTWSSKIKFLLTSKDLWNGVKDPVAHPAQSKKALSIIGLNVEDHHLGSIEECKPAKEAWDLLEKTYKSKTNARKMQLRQELHSLKMKSGEPVTMYVGRAKNLYRDLVATGVEMKPDELAWSVLAGLPKTFSILRTILEASESAISSVDAILPKLLVHEQGFEESPKEKGGGGSDSAVAYVAGQKGKEKVHGKDESRGKGPTSAIIGGSLVTLPGSANVMYVPGVAANLISVSKATEVASVLFKENGNCELEVDGEVVPVARKVKGVYVVNRAEKETCFLVKKPETAELWHRWLGHAGYENLAKMVQGDLVEGVGVKPSAFRALKTLVCEPCIMGKHTRLPESDSVSTEPLEVVHMDVCGPMPVASVGGSRYFATFLDDYSKLSVVVPMKQKSEVAKITEQVINRLELQTGKQLKLVRTDRGEKYVNKAFEDVFGGKGTVHEKTAPYSAQQNGSAEGLNRDLKEKTRAMLEDLGLAKELWAEAVVTANYTRNRTPVSAHGRTPWESFLQ